MLTQAEVRELKKDFPILTPNLVYLDNGATTQKPLAVIEAEMNYYKTANANPHRGAHRLANAATEAYEGARRHVAEFIHAYRVNEVVFTRNTTESLNLLAYSYGLNNLGPGDDIVISILEHHANILPWQMVADKTGANLVYLELDENYELIEDDVKEKITDNCKILSVSGCSNVVGTRFDLKKLFELGHEKGAICIADLAQLIAHDKVDVRELGCDFAVFSGHKMYAAMGFGVLWGRYELLDKLEPFLRGGDMIERVERHKATFLRPAQRFEAGTMNVAGAVSMTAAMDYLDAIGFDKIEAYETQLAEYCIEEMKKDPYLDVYVVNPVGSPYNLAGKRAALVPFNVKCVHPHDVATILDTEGIAVRSGHHCAEPLHQTLGVHATCRASFSFYNEESDVERFIAALKKVRPTMGLKQGDDC